MGISIPSIEKLIDLAELFQVSVDYLLGMDNSLKVDISQLNETEKKYVYNLINIFLDSKK